MRRGERQTVVFFLFLLALPLRAQKPSVKAIQLPQDNPMAQLKPAPGVHVTRQNCATCHSTDYIVLQPRSDTKHWEAEVQKMIKVYGAPISEADTRTIADYLARAYGPEPGAQAPGQGAAKPKR